LQAKVFLSKEGIALKAPECLAISRIFKVLQYCWHGSIQCRYFRDETDKCVNKRFLDVKDVWAAASISQA